MKGILILVALIVATRYVMKHVSRPVSLPKNQWRWAAKRLRFSYRAGTAKGMHTLHGRLHGCDIFVESVLLSGSEAVRFRLVFPEALGMGLDLRAERMRGMVSNLLGGDHDIQTGDDTFDNAVQVNADSSRQLRAFLTPGRRVRVLRFLRLYPGGVIDDQGIRYDHTRSMPDHKAIVGRVRAMARLARSLLEVQTRDTQIDRALEARSDGKLGESLAILDDVRRQPEEGSALESVLAGEVLHLVNRDDEARTAFDEAAAISEADVAFADFDAPDSASPDSGWTYLDEPDGDMTEVDPVAEDSPAEESPAKGASAAAAAAVEPPAPSPHGAAPVEAAPQDEFSVDRVCHALFDPSLSLFQASDVLQRRFADTVVRWSGTLHSSERYSFDLMFGQGPGVKAVIEVSAANESALGRRAIHAIVQFPDEVAETLAQREGETVHFRGTLAKVDGFLRNLFLKNGALD